MPGIDRCLEGPAVLDQERRVRHDEPGRTPGKGGLKRHAHRHRRRARLPAAGLHEISSWDDLQRWCEHFITATRVTDGAGGCPLGSLVGELADQSEPARRVLAQCFAEWQSYLSEGFESMRDNGELAAQADPAELALTMMSALQGGLLMAQATRSARPLELALDMALQHTAAYQRRPRQDRYRQAQAPHPRILGLVTVYGDVKLACLTGRNVVPTTTALTAWTPSIPGHGERAAADATG